ncbi:chromatin accessibility complex protein 1-like [Mytilus californianus]|uniref:chromatin accessibility complex protein 1-like n=1 Tax=Mytilus californianus TaxID=6549 RepID=UPI0022477A5F|nr:chromatin accessibility complex protein 1-like [Mytilus californianus]
MSESKDKNSLPLSRVRTIMKSSPDVAAISQEALYLTGKATELFIQNLAMISLETNESKNSVDYKDLAEVVNSEDVLQFLQDIIPRKIKYSEYLAIKQKEEDES